MRKTVNRNEIKKLTNKEQRIVVAIIVVVADVVVLSAIAAVFNAIGSIMNGRDTHTTNG